MTPLLIHFEVCSVIRNRI